MLWAMFIMGPLCFIGSPIALAIEDETSDPAHGWTPKQATAWTAAQIKYSQAIKEFGVNSPEATDAQVRMNTMARDLGIKAPPEPPEIAEVPKEVETMELHESTDTVHAEPVLTPDPSAPVVP
jgi:hypothetical protein